MLKLDHLSREDHERAAALLRFIQHDLQELARVVARAPFTDRVMRCQKAIQERLIDPLRETPCARDMENGETRLYPSVYYAVGRVK
jgi:hypothetical protein